MSLHDAIKSGSLEAVNRSLSECSTSELRSTGFILLLSESVLAGQREIVKAMLEAGVRVNDTLGVVYPHELPIAKAAEAGDSEMVYLLLSHGAEANVVSEDPEYWTPLMYGAYSGDIEVVRALVEAGADVNVIRSGNSFALQIAAEEGHKEILEYLRPRTTMELRQLLAE